MKPLLEEFICDFPNMLLYLRGDSGFASPDLYEILEDKNCKYAIRLKKNAKLRELAEDENLALYHATKFNQVDYAVEYGGSCIRLAHGIIPAGWFSKSKIPRLWINPSFLSFHKTTKIQL